jgi:O-antigen/teichoic acid export membrane protein
LFPFVLERSRSHVIPEKEYYRFSVTSSVSIFLSTLVLWVDRLFAGVFLSSSDVGIYQSALQISVVFAILMNSFSRILMPTFSALHAKREFNELEEVFRIGTKWGLFIGLPVILFIFMNSDGLLSVIYGSA